MEIKPTKTKSQMIAVSIPKYMMQLYANTWYKKFVLVLKTTETNVKATKQLKTLTYMNMVCSQWYFLATSSVGLSLLAVQFPALHLLPLKFGAYSPFLELVNQL